MKAAAWGLLVTGVLAIAIVVGSRNLSRFDAALVAYTFASLFAVFGIADDGGGYQPDRPAIFQPHTLHYDPQY